MASFTKEDALNYHSKGRPGKIEVIPSKPYSTQFDLSLAYSPGVAEPCLEIEKNLADAYKYTAKGNLVAVISNGTAVLGLGDIGALAGKPVMEGKGLLFKVFADVDVFDIELDSKDVDHFVNVVKAISPTFGGINLEDIKAPQCFEIEERLKKDLDIPVFHDDQHGTAIIAGAGLINALEINKKKIEDIKIVVNGAGASAIACSNLFISLGAKRENLMMLDSKGVLSKKRTDLNPYKAQFAVDTDVVTLNDAMKGADIFCGLSKGNLLDKEMLQSMADDPIVFAMANPTPEVSYEVAMDARQDIIFATGRSDYPNQVNNVLGFPFIFRGALDVGATTINEEMKVAAVHAIAQLAREDVPEVVSKAYNTTNLYFGREYIIPKPLDPRLITTVAPAVAKAAMDTGEARNNIEDWDAYKEALSKRLGLDNQLIRVICEKAKQNPKRLLLGKAENYNVLKAAAELQNQGIAFPVLLGNKEKINALLEKYHIDINPLEIVDFSSPEEAQRRKKYAELLFQKRQRKGMNLEKATDLVSKYQYFGAMMVETGDADAMIAGYSGKYTDVIRPAIEVIGCEYDKNHMAGMFVVMTKNGPLFFADTTVNIQPSAETLVDITALAAREVQKFNIEPVIAMVSYSNFGLTRDGSPKRVQDAIQILHEKHPELIVDGEMQASFALNKELRKKYYPFTKIGDRDVNTIIFPNLSSGNISYKLIHELTGGEVIGPILIGLRKQIHILHEDSSVREIVNLASIAVVDS
jgi:malate dehydrogenase (oxaloacetate-decarboxylating)(NADP+)